MIIDGEKASPNKAVLQSFPRISETRSKFTFSSHSGLMWFLIWVQGSKASGNELLAKLLNKDVVAEELLKNIISSRLGSTTKHFGIRSH